MNKFILLLLIFLTLSCESLKKGLGIEKDVPDEFLIKKIDPIERPPNFELILPGSKKKKSGLETSNTKKILDSNLKKNPNLSNIEKKGTRKIEEDILNNIKN